MITSFWKSFSWNLKSFHLFGREKENGIQGTSLYLLSLDVFSKNMISKSTRFLQSLASSRSSSSIWRSRQAADRSRQEYAYGWPSSRRSFATTTTKGPKTKATPPPAEGFMQGLESSKILCHTRELALANPELVAAGIEKDGTIVGWHTSQIIINLKLLYFTDSHA